MNCSHIADPQLKALAEKINVAKKRENYSQGNTRKTAEDSMNEICVKYQDEIYLYTAHAYSLLKNKYTTDKEELDIIKIQKMKKKITGVDIQKVAQYVKNVYEDPKSFALRLKNYITENPNKLDKIAFSMFPSLFAYFSEGYITSCACDLISCIIELYDIDQVNIPTAFLRSFFINAYMFHDIFWYSIYEDCILRKDKKLIIKDFVKSIKKATATSLYHAQLLQKALTFYGDSGLEIIRQILKDSAILNQNYIQRAGIDALKFIDKLSIDDLRLFNISDSRVQTIPNLKGALLVSGINVSWNTDDIILFETISGQVITKLTPCCRYMLPFYSFENENDKTKAQIQPRFEKNPDLENIYSELEAISKDMNCDILSFLPMLNPHATRKELNDIEITRYILQREFDKRRSEVDESDTIITSMRCGMEVETFMQTVKAVHRRISLSLAENIYPPQTISITAIPVFIENVLSNPPLNLDSTSLIYSCMNFNFKKLPISVTKLLKNLQKVTIPPAPKINHLISDELPGFHARLASIKDLRLGDALDVLCDILKDIHEICELVGESDLDIAKFSPSEILHAAIGIDKKVIQKNSILNSCVQTVVLSQQLSESLDKLSLRPSAFEDLTNFAVPQISSLLSENLEFLTEMMSTMSIPLA